MSDSDKKNVLVWGNIHHAGPDLLKGRDDVALEIVEDVTADIGDRLATLDGIIVRTQRIDAAVLERAPRLAVVARHGVGFDAVDVPALSQRGIPLTTVGEANALTVAEHALFLMLTLAKQGLAYDAATRGDDWKLRETFSCTELWRKTVLVIGFGRIGSRVSRLCRAFGMDVLVIDPYVPAFRIESEGHRRIEDMAAALGRADYVTVHIPLNEETRHLVGAAELAAMKSSAFLNHYTWSDLFHLRRRGRYHQATSTAARGCERNPRSHAIPTRLACSTGAALLRRQGRWQEAL